jgi:hypothetical protein
MAEGDQDKQPSLELPKLGLRRRKRPAPEPDPAPVVQERVEEPVEETRPIVVEDPAPTYQPEPEPEVAPEPRRRAKRERGPGGMASAVLSGLVVGLGIVGLTWASLRSCEKVQGTSSCGDVGYPMLALILVVMVVVGWLLLKVLRVRDPASTSFLGTGLAVVVALLVLVDHLMDRSMVVVVPLICAATFGLAHWVTRTFIEPPRD